jgi:hypothetical protein
MFAHLTRLFGRSALAALLLLVSAGALSAVDAAIVTYTATLDGASESPPVASAGSGFATVEIDAVAHTMRVVFTFSGLTGTTTASHIHAATATAGTGTAGVATQTPTFASFPTGVTSGSYDATFDMTQAASYNPAYVTANGGTIAGAEAALFQAIADGKAYLNIHTTFAPGGEIRGFLQPGNALPTDNSTWGRVKALYR